MSLNPNIPVLHRNEVPTPPASPAGVVFVFYDADNKNHLTSKDSNCDFEVLQINPIHIDTDCLCDAVDKVIEAASCALNKSHINATEYQSIIQNVNYYSNVMFDIVTGSYQHSITSEPSLFVSLTLTHVLCNGSSTGTAAASVSGGVAPYVLDWGGDDPANLAAGTHTLTVTDANGVSKAVSFIISEPAAVTGDLSSTDESTGGASDGTATVVAGGGVAPYTYLWDDPGAQTTATATGLLAGDYNVVVTDANGCINPFGPVTVSVA
ncbi:MAG: hypothetical protein GY861_13375 [bacterium]|nr:hypothetical protein [bacterium]